MPTATAAVAVTLAPTSSSSDDDCASPHLDIDGRIEWVIPVLQATLQMLELGQLRLLLQCGQPRQPRRGPLGIDLVLEHVVRRVAVLQPLHLQPLPLLQQLGLERVQLQDVELDRIHVVLVRVQLGLQGRSLLRQLLDERLRLGHFSARVWTNQSTSTLHQSNNSKNMIFIARAGDLTLFVRARRLGRRECHCGRQNGGGEVAMAGLRCGLRCRVFLLAFQLAFQNVSLVVFDVFLFPHG